MESEILRDKEIIWQCVSCNKCTYACPRDVVPEGVMKALSHWLELKGHVKKSPSMVFDEVFSEQVFERGKIEEGRVMQRFFKRTGQDLRQPWLIEMVKRMLRHLPVGMLSKMGLATLVAPSTSGWSGARAAIREYVEQQEHRRRQALGLDALIEGAKRDAAPAAAGHGVRS
jgi:heterodisulfide reductase subunit C